jgi:transposase
MEKHLCRRANRSVRIRRLMSVPGVGPISALAYTALSDDPLRFGCAESVRCYLGLVPSEDSSADYQHRGRITRAGNSQVRWLLVQDGWSVLRGKTPAGRRLREWGRKIAARRGKGKAVVALARKLAGVLWSMDCHQKEFDMMR